MFFLQRTVKQLMVVEWLSGKRSYDNHGFVAHAQIHQNESAFVCMRFEPFFPEHAIMVTHKTLTMPFHISTALSHIVNSCETAAPDECCMSGTVDVLVFQAIEQLHFC